MNKFSWYINRFSLMSPAEMVSRSRSELIKKFTKVKLKDFTPDISLSGVKVNWYFSFDEKNKIQAYLKSLGWNDFKAKKHLEHKFTFFSLEDKNAGSKINWHCDYKNDRIAPLKYCKDIDYRDFGQVGDFKYIWETNRHQHLISLAKAFYMTGDERYKKEIRAQILSWIDGNPYLMGINWESALELGVRLISWSWIWHFIGEIDEEWRKKWLESIYKHCLVISKNFSKYSSANNHLIGEAAGLYVASVVWPFKANADEWRKKAFDVLVREMELQNYADGVNREQAMSYQQFVMDFFLLSGLLGEKNGERFPKSYWSRMERMCEYLASVMDVAGNVPNIGDSDDGFAVALSDNDVFNPFQSLLRTGAVLFDRGDLRSNKGKFDEKSFLLLSQKGLEQFNSLTERPFARKKEFKDGGYYILSANDGLPDEILSVFDCGPLGYLSLAAHGHADSLSFTLNVSGKEFLIDPGTYVYQDPKEWRNYFKGTAAHNTVRINGVDQSVVGGNFMWLLKARSEVIKYESGKDRDAVKGEHYGYKRLKDPVIHRREVVFDKPAKTFKVIDEIDAKGENTVEQFFHFAKKCQVRQAGANEYEITNGAVKIRMKIDPQLASEVARGQANPILGWMSKRFDTKMETVSMRNHTKKEGPLKFETVITVLK